MINYRERIHSGHDSLDRHRWLCGWVGLVEGWCGTPPRNAQHSTLSTPPVRLSRALKEGRESDNSPLHTDTERRCRPVPTPSRGEQRENSEIKQREFALKSR